MASDFDPYYRWLGIPPKEQPPDHYRLLGVDRFETDRELISTASDQRMTHLRTFASGQRSADSQRLLNEVSAATRCLLDPDKKKKYDDELRAKLPKEPKPQPKQSLPVAQAIPLPMVPVGPDAAPVATATAVAPVVVEHPPISKIARRGPLRKSNNVALLTVAGLLLVGLIGAGAAVAYFVVQKPLANKPTPTKNGGQRKTDDKTRVATDTKGSSEKGPEKPAIEVPKTPTEIQTKPVAEDTRVAWFYLRNAEGARGLIHRVADKQWEERIGDGRTYRFEEKERNDETITLFDSSRKLTIRLSKTQLESSRDEQRWVAAQRGQWVSETQVAGLLASMSGTPRTADQRTIWFYPKHPQRTTNGFIRRTGTKSWEEVWEGSTRVRYDEVQRSPDYIELVTNNLPEPFTIRLYTDHAEYKGQGQNWSRVQNGSWVSPGKLTDLLASSTSTRPSTATFADLSKLVFEGRGKAVVALRQPLEVDKPFTIEFWLRRTDVKSSLGVLRLGKLSIVLGVEMRNGEQVTSCEFNNGKWKAAYSKTMPDLEWHHFAAIGDGTKIHAFLDGQPAHDATFESLNVDKLSPIELGSADSHYRTESMQAEVSSIRISDQARYSDGQTFDPPSPRENELLSGTTIALEDVKELKPRRTLVDLVNPPRGSSSPASVRTAPPEAEALKAAQATIAGTYGDRIKAAVKPDDRLKLGRELLEVASTESDAAAAFALLIEARRLAIMALDVSLGLDVINQLDRRFAVDRAVAVEKLLSEMTPKNLAAAQREMLTDEAMSSAMTALQQDQVPLAEDLASLAVGSSNKGKDPDKKKMARSLRDYVSALKTAWEAKQAGLEKLKQSPDDPAANLAVGRYVAFALGDFEKGCEHLAKGSDAPLADAAKKESSAKSEEEKLAAAEAWSALVASLKPVEKLGLQRHILSVCREVAPRLTGLKKGQAEKHITELQPIIAEADKNRPAPPKPPKFLPGLIVRVLAGRNPTTIPTPYMGVARSEQDLFRFNASDLVRPYNTSYYRFAMSGVVILEEDTDVQLYFEDCRGAIGSQAFEAGRGAQMVNQRTTMKKGTYPITILATDYYPNFRVTRVSTGNNFNASNSLLFYNERDLEIELNKPVQIPTGAIVKGQRVD